MAYLFRILIAASFWLTIFVACTPHGGNVLKPATTPPAATLPTGSSSVPVAQATGGGGADTGGAGDYDANRIYAWFSDKSPTYCVQVEPDFGLPKDQAEVIIDQAIAKWQYYLQKRQTPFYRLFKYQEGKFLKQPSCNEGTTIRFALGKMLVGSPKSRFAYASIENFDQTKEFGTGTIYIRKQSELPTYIAWSSPNNLLAVTMHEIGHALGNEHITGTIMDVALSDWIKLANEKKLPKYIEEIDIQYELASSDSSVTNNIDGKNCHKKKYDGLYDYSEDVAPGDFENGIAELIGRRSIGPWRISVEDDCGTINFKDDAGTEQGRIQLIDVLAYIVPPGEIFANFNKTAGMGWGSVRSARIKMKSGKESNVLVRFNLIPSAFSIDIMKDDKKVPLFRAADPWEIQHEHLNARFGIQYSVD